MATYFKTVFLNLNTIIMFKVYFMSKRVISLFRTKTKETVSKLEGE